MIEKNLLQQVKDILASLDGTYQLSIERDPSRDNAAAFSAFLEDFASASDRITTAYTDGKDFRFRVLRNGEDTGIAFRGIPSGHEFSSLLLAILNSDGKGKNLPDEGLARRIARLKGPLKVQTFVSLTCTNCPDVVQALNLLALGNPGVTHEMVDGALHQDEADRLRVQGVPAVFVNGEPLHTGRGELGTLLQKMEEKYGTADVGEPALERAYDVLVMGGGPAGASAAIYSARKGLKVAVVAQRIGGQVAETTGIENLVSVPHTTGTRLAADIKSHLQAYAIDLYENRQVTAVSVAEGQKSVTVAGGEVFLAPALIVATGASWRRLGLPGEDQLLGHGVHFCPHCDGPFYKGKAVAVVGGGNSGAEAAIDLAGICSRVTLIEFADEMRADSVLQQKLQTLPNVEVFTSTQTTALHAADGKLTGITVKDRKSGEERDMALDGIFVQIGLAPNSALFKDQLALTPRGELVIDETNRTSQPGVYGAGDVTTVPYKQIMIAMGEGAKAALSAFDDRVRGVI